MGNVPGASAIVFTEPNQHLPTFTGEAQLLYTPPPGRYDRISVSEMGDWKLLWRIQSATTYCPPVGASSLIIFSDPTPAPQDYQGEFIQLTNFNRKFEFDFNLASGGVDNYGDPYLYANSVLLVHTQRALEKKLSFSNLVLPLLGQLSQSLPPQVTLAGAPRLSWAPFPVGEQYLSSNRIYLSLLQDLTVDFSEFWANYSAAVQFYFDLTVSGGKLNGHVQRYDTWVEGGLFADVIAAILNPNVKLGVISINSALSNLAPGVPVKDVYYLPGSQVSWPIKPGDWNVFEGETFNDVTIVLELGT
jgi:hypothetical protein